MSRPSQKPSTQNLSVTKKSPIRTKHGLVPAKRKLSLEPRNKRDEALRRLGLKEDSERLIVVTPQLAQAEGGLPQVLEALRASDDPDAVAFIAQYDSVSEDDLRRVSWEEISMSAGVEPKRLLEISVSALFEQQQTVASIIAATAHPLVVRKTVQMALTDGGKRDREMLHLAQGFLPTPKGSTVINRVQIANMNGKAAAEEAPLQIADDLPSMEDDLAGLSTMQTSGKLLNP